MRRGALLVGLIAVPFLLSSCFVLVDFWVGDPVVAPGGKTAAMFTLFPEDRASEKRFQFILVGVDTPDQVGIGKATWDVFGAFNGPTPMVVQPNLAGVLVSSGMCESSGLNFQDITGMTWKGFTTPIPVADKGKVGRPLHVRVALTAKATATPEVRSYLLGVTGVWADDGDGVVEGSPDDAYACFGISTSSLFVSS